MRVGGILVRGAEKRGGGANRGAGEVDVKSIKTSRCRIGGIIAAITHPGEAEERDLRRCAEQRNFFRGDLQIGRLHAAVDETIEQSSKRRTAIGQLRRTFFARRREGLHVARFEVSAGELKTQRGKKKMVRGAIGQQRAALQRAGSCFEGKRIGAAGEIELAELNGAARAEVQRLGHRAITGRT